MSSEKSMISQSDLETYLWKAAILLRGKIDSSDYREYIFPLLFFKRISDVYDEELEAELVEFGESYPENHRFQIPDGAHWNDVRQVTANVGLAIQTAMREIEKANPELLTGIFGTAKWTNKDRLSDVDLRDLLEHFSTQQLGLTRVSQDELGQGYETLIKWFADDAGHTAAEFYTNRTLVTLMIQMLEPKEHESLYDPTCGSGGMLLVGALALKEAGMNYRTLKLYGQDINHITTSIARMNLFLHGIEDFKIVRDDVLRYPAFLEHDALKTFDMVLANPPYSVKQWNRKAFENDPFGRNMFGVPPQGRADYAFFQHILKSMDPETGRCAILFPHGVLFRDTERSMRKKLVEADLVECVLGLGPNLFYNSPMEACVIVCRMSKPEKQLGKVLFINAVDEVTHESAQSFLKPHHIEKIAAAYRSYQDSDGFSKVVTNEEILAKDGNMSIPLYVHLSENNDYEPSLKEHFVTWEERSSALEQETEGLYDLLKEAGLYE